MKKEISKLLEVRESVRVVDATLRDGGLVNDFYFTDEFAKALYLTNVKAGVDYMEWAIALTRSSSTWTNSAHGNFLQMNILEKSLVKMIPI